MAATLKTVPWRKTIAAGLTVMGVILVMLSLLLVFNVARALQQAGTQQADHDAIGARYALRITASQLQTVAAHYNPMSPYAAPALQDAMGQLQLMLDHLHRSEGSGESGNYLQAKRHVDALRADVEQMLRAPDQIQGAQADIVANIDEMKALLAAGAAQEKNTSALLTEDLEFGLSICMLLVACIILGVARRIASRTRLLTQTVQQMAAGNLNLEAEVNGDDELAAIASAFNDMTAQVRATLEKEGRFFTLSAHLLCIFGYDGHFKRLSRAWHGLLGQSEEMLLATPLVEFIQRDDRDATARAISRVITSGTEIAGLENAVVDADGQVRWLSWNLKPVPADELIYCVAMEVTERLQAERDREKLMGSIQEGTVRLSSATTSVLTSSSQHARGAQDQAAAIAETVAAVEEVEQTTRQSTSRAAAVAESSQLALESGKAGRQAVEETIAAMEQVRKQVESIAGNILQLAEQAQNIGEIVASVDHIADQTNLLALNAAIEAARAGEQGKGFTVVANEIRLLADQSKRATVQVRQMLTAIQKLTQRSVLSMEQGTRSVGEAATVVLRADDTIRELVDAVSLAATSASHILTSANQQSVGMKQIHHAMKNIQEITTQTLAATRSAQAAVQELNGLADSLKAMLATNGHAVVTPAAT